MSGTFILKTLDAVVPAPGTVTSLVFHIPFPDHVPLQLFERYQALRAERGLDEDSHYEKAAGQLVLEVYQEESIQVERTEWSRTAAAAFHEVLTANKASIRHVELILPTGGIVTPLDLFPSLKELDNLESFCVQWPLRGYMPITLLLMRDWAHILDGSITADLARWHTALMDSLAHHAGTLKRLRISLPESTHRKPFSAMCLDVARFPALPALELLDITHWGRSIRQMKAFLTPSVLPRLQHLIVDDGGEIPAADYSDSDEEAPDDWDYNTPRIHIQTHSWPALGAHLASFKLRSLCAAIHGRAQIIFVRLNAADLRSYLQSGGAPDELIVCTAWPRRYEPQEPGYVSPTEGAWDDKDLYVHAPGCGHLAYPEDQRPTTGLYSDDGERGELIMAGQQWY
ncbi:hypothetical protein DFH06DRAFT_1167188 [Mycena polygramma]|nr:hypothetical protein DFH06DRAFT_1167188 [Mycena polygramma]